MQLVVSNYLDKEVKIVLLLDLDRRDLPLTVLLSRCNHGGNKRIVPVSHLIIALSAVPI